MKNCLALIMAILLILFMPSCGIIDIPDAPQTEDEPAPSATPQATEPPPRKGGELRVALTSPDVLNPHLTQSRDMLNFLGLIFESPIAYDSNRKPVPSLVTSWETSPDGRLWVFDVCKNVEWHNGESLTGEDILFTLEALQSGVLDSFYQENIFENINIVEANLRGGDPYSFYISLAEPSYLILDILTFPVLSKNVYQSVDNIIKISKDQFPVGTGPYLVDSDYSGEEESIKLVKNQNWWGDEPYISSVLGIKYDTNDEARLAFQNGEVDMVDTSIIYANTRLSPMNSDHYKYLTPSFEFLAFNHNNTMLQDNTIKKAIAYALNRKDIISKVYLNNAETVDVPIQSKSWLYDSRYRIYDYDPKKALRLLQEEGWGDSDRDGMLDRIINEEKVDLTFSLITNSENDFRRDTVDLIAKQLEAIGIRIEVEFVSWDLMQTERLPEGEFDAILTGYNLDMVHDLRFFLHSNQIGEGLGNFMGYNDPEMDQLLDNAARAASEEDRWEAYQGIQKHLTQEMPIISLYFRTGSMLYDNRVKGINHIGEWNIYSNIKDWYLAE
ncbi:MAG: hypothetical protein GX783_03950 [Clostridiales bacterium]|nr:hypothetical protein [Clostridiales bacterium]